MNYNSIIYDNCIESDLRFERKFLITHLPLDFITYSISNHPSYFREIYHKRRVNSIYFDTESFSFYKDNVNGLTERVKFRIRWYGDIFNNLSIPSFEIKIKKGLISEKRVFKLRKMDTSNLSEDYLKILISESDIPDEYKKIILFLKPVLLNSYERYYYLSSDSNFRLTIDLNMNFFRFSSFDNDFIQSNRNRLAHVVEIKYSPEHDDKIPYVSNNLPFRMTKNSKYVDGINRIYFNSYRIE